MIILKRFQAFCQIFTWRKVCIIGCKRLPASEKEWNSLSLKGFDSEWCSAKLEAYKNCKSTKKNYQKCEIKLIRTSPEERINQGGKSTLRKVHFFHSETIGQGKLYIQHTYITSFVFHITHLAQRCLSKRKIPASHQRVGQRPRLLNIFCSFQRLLYWWWLRHGKWH